MIEIGNTDGLGYGLNKRSKAAKAEKKVARKAARKAKGGSGFKRFIKKNVNLKTALKGISIAANTVPGGGFVGKALNLINNSAGQLVMDKVDSGQPFTPQDEQVAKQIIVANETDPNTPNVLTPVQFQQIAPRATQAIAPMYQPTQAVQSEDQNEPQGDVVPVKLATQNTVATPLDTATKNNTMLYVGGGVLALGIIYALTHKKQ